MATSFSNTLLLDYTPFHSGHSTKMYFEYIQCQSSYHKYQKQFMKFSTQKTTVQFLHYSQINPYNSHAC